MSDPSPGEVWRRNSDGTEVVVRSLDHPRSANRRMLYKDLNNGAHIQRILIREFLQQYTPVPPRHVFTDESLATHDAQVRADALEEATQVAAAYKAQIAEGQGTGLETDWVIDGLIEALRAASIRESGKP